MKAYEQPIRVFIYIRVSTQEQVNEGYSIVAQEERLRAYSKARGYTIVKVFIDPAYSGSNMDRPALQEMTRGIEQGLSDLVLVYKLDRLSRSQKDTLYLIEEVFLKNNVDFVSMNESFDTSTPFGRAMIGILSVFAQLEREQIRERSMMGKEQRAKEGKWHGGGGKDRVVTGYDYIEGELILNEYESACVKYLFATYNEGHGMNKVYRMAADKFPGVIAGESSVRKIITNPLYTGKINYNENEYDGIHEPIIENELFLQTQELISKRTSTTDPFRREYLFSGLIYCEYCGSRMHGRSGGHLKDGTLMRYYVCSSRQKRSQNLIEGPACTKSGERKEKLEEYLISAIKKLNVHNLSEISEHRSTDTGIKTALEKEKTGIEGQISKLMDLYSVGGIPIEDLGNKIESLNQDKEKVKSHIQELIQKDKTVNIDEIKKTVSQLATFDWTEEDTAAKRLIAAKLIDKIIVSDDDITIEWAF